MAGDGISGRICLSSLASVVRFKGEKKSSSLVQSLFPWQFSEMAVGGYRVSRPRLCLRVASPWERRWWGLLHRSEIVLA